VETKVESEGLETRRYRSIFEDDVYMNVVNTNTSNYCVSARIERLGGTRTPIHGIGN
jgi:hypothetical protein